MVNKYFNKDGFCQCKRSLCKAAVKEKFPNAFDSQTDEIDWKHPDSKLALEEMRKEIASRPVNTVYLDVGDCFDYLCSECLQELIDELIEAKQQLSKL